MLVLILELSKTDKLGIYALRTTIYQGSTIINLCDIELIGRILKQDKVVIEITKQYFQQEVIGDYKARQLLQLCSIANLVGKGIVRSALDLRLAKEDSIKKIAGVPFLMIYKFGLKY